VLLLIIPQRMPASRNPPFGRKDTIADSPRSEQRKTSPKDLETAFWRILKDNRAGMETASTESTGVPCHRLTGTPPGLRNAPWTPGHLHVRPTLSSTPHFDPR
jgi:hypothetical protein